MIKRKKQEDTGDDYKVSFSVKIGGRVIESDLEDALFIPTVDKLNPTTISNMMAEIPSLHARWNFLYNEAVYEYDTKKIKLEVWISRKGQEYRKMLSKSNDKRVTDKMVDEAIKTDPEFERYNDDVAIAKKNMKHILAQAGGFGEKGDKITSIASMLKWEGENMTSTGKYNHIGRKKEEKDHEAWPEPK